MPIAASQNTMCAATSPLNSPSPPCIDLICAFSHCTECCVTLVACNVSVMFFVLWNYMCATGIYYDSAGICIWSRSRMPPPPPGPAFSPNFPPAVCSNCIKVRSALSLSLSLAFARSRSGKAYNTRECEAVASCWQIPHACLATVFNLPWAPVIYALCVQRLKVFCSCKQNCLFLYGTCIVV